ncbi:hypothetical protein ACFLUM_01890 [Chloroflexota bacterium]
MADEILAQLVAVYPNLRAKVLCDEYEPQGGIGRFSMAVQRAFWAGLDIPERERDELALSPPIGGG